MQSSKDTAVTARTALDSTGDQKHASAQSQRTTHTTIHQSSTYGSQSYGVLLSDGGAKNSSPSLSDPMISHSASMTSYQSMQTYVPPPEVTKALSAQVLDMLDRACNGGLTIEQKIKTVELILSDAMREQAQTMQQQQTLQTTTSMQQQQSSQMSSSNGSMVMTTSAGVASQQQSLSQYQSPELQLQLLRQQQQILQQQIERQSKLQPYPQQTSDQRQQLSASMASSSSTSVESHVNKKMKSNHHSPSASFDATSEATITNTGIKKETEAGPTISTSMTPSMSIPSIPPISTNLPATAPPVNMSMVSPASVTPSSSSTSSSNNAPRLSASKKKKKNRKTSRDTSLDATIGFASPLIEDRMLSSRAFSKICLQNFLTLDTLKSYTIDFESEQTSKAAVQQYLSWLSSQLEADEKISLIENFTALSIADARAKQTRSTNELNDATKSPAVTDGMQHDAVTDQQTSKMQIDDRVSSLPHSIDLSQSAPSSSASSPISSSSSVSALSSTSSTTSSTKQSLPHNIRLMDMDGSLLSPDRAIADDLDGLARWKLTMVIPTDLSKKRKQPTPPPPPPPPPSMSQMDDSDDATSSHDSISAKEDDDDDDFVSHPLHGIIQVNRAWERLTGFTQDYMVNLTAGERPFKFLRSDFVPAAHRLMLFVQMNKMSELIKQYVVIVHKDGTEQYCLEAWRLSFDERGIFLALSDMITPLPSSEVVPPFVPGREMDEATLIYGYRNTSSKQMHWKEKILSQKSGNNAATIAPPPPPEPMASITAASSSDILSINASALSSATVSATPSSSSESSLASSSATSV